MAVLMLLEDSARQVWNRCATFEHTWLKRRLLPQLTRDKAYWLAGTQGIPPFLQGLSVRLAEVEEFLGDALQGYSPVQLMYTGPLAELPPDVRAHLTEMVHQRYLDAQVIQPLISTARSLTAEMRTTTDKLLNIWMQGNLDRRTELWERLAEEAAALREVLVSFPGDIILP